MVVLFVASSFIDVHLEKINEASKDASRHTYTYYPLVKKDTFPNISLPGGSVPGDISFYFVEAHVFRKDATVLRLLYPLMI